MKKVISILLVLGIFAGGAYYYWLESNRMVQSDLQIEVNEAFDPSLALKDQSIAYTTKGEVDTSILGIYPITYQIQEKNYVCQVHVVDTIAPVFTLKEGTIRLNQLNQDVSILVESVNDETKVDFRIKDTNKYKEPGDYEMEIIGKDEGGNTYQQKGLVHLLEGDYEPPVISGLDDLTLKQNEAYNYYRLVSIQDNLDESPYYEIDFSNLDVSKAGEYQIIYKAYDHFGNAKEYTRNVKITNESAPTSRVIYLTFDDGPSKNTPEILRILNQYHVLATFFVTGANPSYYSCFQQENDEGHAIAIHTMSHDYPTIYASKEAYINDFTSAQDLVQSYIGYRPNIFRFPGGSSNHESMKYCTGIMSDLANWANENGYEYYDWNVVSGDGNVRTSTPEMINIIKKSPQLDSIMLLCHDSGAAVNTVKALPTIIQYYQGLGYTFKVIDHTTEEFHHKIAN